MDLQLSGKTSEPRGVSVSNAPKAAVHAWAKGFSREMGKYGMRTHSISVFTFALVAACALYPVPARTQSAAGYPNKPIRIVDGFPPGGATNYLDRVIGQKLTERWGQPVVVDNRPGLGSNLGAEIAAKATPDGYTLFMALSAAVAPGRVMYPRLQFDLMKDFVYVTLVASGVYILVTNPAVPAKWVGDLIAMAKSKPGQISYGSGGIGTPPHLAGELLKTRAGINMLHVPYKGAGPLVTAMVGREVDIGLSSVASVVPLVKAGRLNAIAVTGTKRSKAFPDVPTIAESGVPGFDVTGWYGLLAPTGTPRAVINVMNAEIGKILRLPDIQTLFETQGFEATGSTPERYREIMQSEIELWTKVIKDAGIKAE